MIVLPVQSCVRQNEETEITQIYLGVIVTLAPYKERKNLIADTVMVFD